MLLAGAAKSEIMRLLFGRSKFGPLFWNKLHATNFYQKIIRQPKCEEELGPLAPSGQASAI